LSGSCPLCLTPPCYHLEPPATAALFSLNAAADGRFFAGNYVGSFHAPVSGQHERPARCCVPV
jgi:hypothetical protein